MNSQYLASEVRQVKTSEYLVFEVRQATISKYLAFGKLHRHGLWGGPAQFHRIQRHWLKN